MSNSWESEHIWTPVLETNFSIIFYKCCKLYPHYLDTVLDGLEIIKTGKNMEDINGYTAVDTDLFLPKGLYKGEQGVEIIFDSGCTHAVTPREADLWVVLNLSQKS